MAEGGLHDHLGGGFFRYCVDAQLGDSALREDAVRQRAAAAAVCDGCRRLGEPGFARSRATPARLDRARDDRAATGGFFSSLDADSEGEEGRYYVWQRDEIRALLDDEEFADRGDRVSGSIARRISKGKPGI